MPNLVVFCQENFNALSLFQTGPFREKELGLPFLDICNFTQHVESNIKTTTILPDDLEYYLSIAG